MIELENGARFLKQWQQDKKVIIDNFFPGTRVEFSAKYDCKDSALPVKAYVDGDHVVADIPNILLQVAGYIRVSVLPSTDDTENGPEIRDIRVVQAEKPADYVYRETKTISYEALEKRVEELEKNSGDAEVLTMLIDTDMLPAVHDTSGAILTDQNGNIILRY